MASTASSEKSGMDKINESMEKIGAMLGVQPSHSSDDKKEALIKKEVPVKISPVTKKRQEEQPDPVEEALLAVNSAEGHVIAPPTIRKEEETSQMSRMSGTVYTKPTEPGKTKTAAGAAIANVAARVDNVVNVWNKSVKKLGKAACGDEPAADVEQQQHRTKPTKVLADGSTVTTDYSAPHARQPARPIPSWMKKVGIFCLVSLVVIGLVAIIPGSGIHAYFRDIHDDHSVASDPEMTIAFIGNSYLFVNDVPRVMETLGAGHIVQQSVINTGAGLGSLLKQGNGMYELWQTQNALDFWGGFDFKALMENTDIEIDDDYLLYDFGMCTVPQLLEGYDGYLSYKNSNEVYFDVGTNPCFEDEYYMTLIQQASFKDPMYFDYVILNDQTRRMANYDAREDSIDALTQAYAPLIKASRAVPIFLDTHAFFFEDDGKYTNETINNVFIGSSVAAFTSAIYEGLYEYVYELGSNLPSKQQPLIAKVGMTYLAIYEDSVSQWEKLFSTDAIHASQAGTYLTACVLYCAIYGHLPGAIHSDYDMRSLFFRSRALYGNATATPPLSQVNYLRKWAKKVQLDGYVPKTMVLPQKKEAEDYEVQEDDEGEEGEYSNGGYNNGQ